MLRPRRYLFMLVVAASCCVVFWHSARMQSPLRRITNTTEEGMSFSPSLSGDGRVLAFESTEDVAQVGGDEGFRGIRANVANDPATLVQMGATRAPAPGVSQDGSRIAFASKDNPLGTNNDANSEIFLYNGATLVQITNTSPGDVSNRAANGNFAPSISDDGRFIAFASNRDLANQNADGNLEIFVFDTLAASFSQLTNSSGTVGCSDAKISGNGASVLYIRDAGTTSGTNRDLVLQNRTDPPSQSSPSSFRVIATSVPSLALPYGRAISDDGARVVWSAQTATNTTQVFLFDGRNNNTVRQLTALGSRATDVPLHPSISGNGNRMSFATRRAVVGTGSNSDTSVELYTFDVPSGTLGRVTNVNSSSATAEVVSSLNDNGSVIAFNFPRILSGVVANSDFANNSEIYLSGTPLPPPVGTLTVLNRASMGHESSSVKAVAPDSIAVAVGSALAFTTEQSQRLSNGTFPMTVGGTTVTVNGLPAQIFFVSPTEVHFHVPFATATGSAEVVVTNSDGFQSRGNIVVTVAAPGVFTKSGDGSGDGMILNADTLQEGPFDPTSGNLRLLVFATGVRNGAAVSASAGGRPLTLESIVRSPSLPGMDELHLLVPADLRGVGRVDLVVRADARDSNPVGVTFIGDANRDIMINEFLADPPGSVATDLAGDANHDGVRDSADDEFVELVNTTTHDIDVSGYQILTRSSTATNDTLRFTFPSGTIMPACTAIVVFGGGAFDPQNPVFGGARVFRPPTTSGSLSLTNTGGVITLHDATGTIVNLITYGGSTGLNGNAGQSLTRSPDLSGSLSLHQGASGSGGSLFSPGTQLNGATFNSCTPAIARVEVSPSSATIVAGEQQQFTARAFDAGNNEIPGVIFSWLSSNLTAATIDQHGLATGQAAGSTEILATGRGVQSAPVVLTVNPIVPPNVVINEVDSDQAGTDAGEFVEIYEGGAGNTSLTGLVVVFFNGGDDKSYEAFDLDGFSTNANGYFTLGNIAVPGVDFVFPDGTMQNGADAIAMYVGNASDFPNGTSVTTTNLIDALVYDTTDADDPGLLVLLNPGQPQVNEDAGGNGTANSNQRCPNGSGGARNTSTYNQFAPTPDGANVCAVTPTLTINDVSLSEGNTGMKLFTFTISLSAPATANVTFDLTTADGTAQDGNQLGEDNDYGFRREIGRTIPAGSQSFTFDIAVNGDTKIEADETFFLNVTTVSGATVADGQGQGTIQNDDSPTLSIDDISQAETDSGTTTFTFTVASSLPAPAGGITFDIATADGTAQDDTPPAEDNDYLAKSLTARTIPAGATTYAFDVTVNGDTLVESNETFFVNLSNVVNASVSDGQGQGTIQNDDTALLVISQLYGGGNNSGATFQNDFVELFNRGSTTVNFAATPYSVQYASASGTFSGGNTISLTTGSLVPGQYFLISLAGGTTNGAALPPADATNAGINMSATDGKVALVAGTTALGGSGCPIGPTVADFVGYGSANCAETTATAALSATKSARRTTSCVDTNNNAADFNVVTNPAAPRNSSSPLNDCNAPPNLTIDSVTVAEGNSGPVVATFTVSLSKPAPPAGVTFDIATQNDSATTADNDYVAHSLTAQTIISGHTTYTFDVTVNGDMTVEPDETFFVNVTNVSGAVVVDGQGVGTIQNDDSAPLPNLTVDDVSIAEGNTGPATFTFTISLSAPAGAGGVSFNIATADGSAQDDTPPSEDNDYAARSLTAQTIAAGNTSYTFDVTVNGDLLVEPNETFVVNVSSVTGANVTDGVGQATIQNDDTPLVVISQVYGGGGNASATYRNDFIEIFNRGMTTIDFSVTPYSVQYAAAASNFTTNKTDITSGVLLPGHHFLVQEASGGAVGMALPTPDAGGTINMSATAGKVALVSATTALTGSGCPFGATVVDFLGYGTTANCSETAPIAVSGTNANARSVIRTVSCTDTNNNAADFSHPVTAPVARNTATTPAPCP